MYTLLYLAPQPRDTNALDSRQDIQSIGYRLSQLGLQPALKVQEEINPRFVDLPFWLDRLTPQLVHFSGHGTNLAKLVFVDNQGNRHDVAPDAVASLFAAQATKVPVKGLILNTCYALPVAKELVSSVDFVISTGTEIQDQSAIHFAETFYPFFINGSSLQMAFEQGRTQVLANRRSGQDPPTLLTRPGVDAATYRLATPVEPPKERFIFVHFCPGSTEDRRLANELLTFLRAQQLPFWDVTQVDVGARVAEEIARALARATHVIPLISVDAQADARWMEILRQARAQKVSLVPVKLRPTMSLPELDDVEQFPPGSRAMSQYPKRDAIWVKLVEQLRERDKKP